MVIWLCISTDAEKSGTDDVDTMYYLEGLLSLLLLLSQRVHTGWGLDTNTAPIHSNTTTHLYKDRPRFLIHTFMTS